MLAMTSVQSNFPKKSWETLFLSVSSWTLAYFIGQTVFFAVSFADPIA
jgi:hypothetical protein